MSTIWEGVIMKNHKPAKVVNGLPVVIQRSNRGRYRIIMDGVEYLEPCGPGSLFSWHPYRTRFFWLAKRKALSILAARLDAQNQERWEDGGPTSKGLPTFTSV